MGRVAETVAVAFGMFSRVPCPQPEWGRENMRYALVAFPLVGVVIGALVAAWCALSAHLGDIGLLRAAGIVLVPIAVTGGIHLDGFCDTHDALASMASPERRREILSDSHSGAFALINLGVYLVAYLALADALRLDAGMVWALACGYVLERALSAWAVVRAPSSKRAGLAFAFSSSADARRASAALVATSCACAAAMTAAAGLAGALMVVSALVALAVYLRCALAKFEGVSGDLAGWFLQRCELAMLAAAVFVQILEGVLA